MIFKVGSLTLFCVWHGFLHMQMYPYAQNLTYREESSLPATRMLCYKYLKSRRLGSTIIPPPHFKSLVMDKEKHLDYTRICSDNTGS